MAYVWSVECPHDDQGMVAPLVTESGRIVLMCDRGGEVWLKMTGGQEAKRILQAAQEYDQDC